MLHKLLNSSLAIALSFAIAGCDVDQTREGELPDADVSVEPGQMPSYDVDGPEVDLDMEESEVLVPDVEMKEKTIETPDLDVTLPEND